MKLQIKLLTAILAMVLNSGLCLAQNENNVITHTIARGETLTSIAKRYSVSEAQIIELNPDAAQFVYVGMDLKIPVVAAQETKKLTISDNSASVANHALFLEQTSSATEQTSTATNEISESIDWTQASYLYSFEDGPAKYKSAYGLHWTIQTFIHNKYGWGATFGAMANAGFVPFENSTLSFFAGPAFSFLPGNTNCVFFYITSMFSCK